MNISLPPKTILLPSPVLIIGTFGKDGKPNIMNAAWGGIASSKPPCISISLREATLTYHNIKHSEAFTVNIPSEKYLKESDYVGIVSGKDHNKFEETNLTPVKSKLVNAPYIDEFPYALECKLLKQIELGLHTMFIGEIMGIIANKEILTPDNLPDIEKVKPMLFGSFGNMAYYGIGEKLGDAFSVGKDIQKKQDSKESEKKI
jgi:flavin reductase (DIM6/NTAB) family NADH-FMN oxidoreductase RutF